MNVATSNDMSGFSISSILEKTKDADLSNIERIVNGSHDRISEEDISIQKEHFAYVPQFHSWIPEVLENIAEEQKRLFDVDDNVDEKENQACSQEQQLTEEDLNSSGMSLAAEMKPISCSEDFAGGSINQIIHYQYRDPHFKRHSFYFQCMAKPKRNRTTYTALQLIYLEKIFRSNQYLVGEERKQLARYLDLSETQIKVWFQNRRTKDRKVKIETPNISLAQMDFMSNENVPMDKQAENLPRTDTQPSFDDDDKYSQQLSNNASLKFEANQMCKEEIEENQDISTVIEDAQETTYPETNISISEDL